MTVITKAITEKKASDKMEQPLFVEENATDGTKADLEAACSKTDEIPKSRCFISRTSIRRIHLATTFLLFLLALSILLIGMIGGLYVYKQYARTQMRRFSTGWYSIPYDSSNKASYGSNAVHQGLLADSDLFTKSLTRAMEQDALDIAKHIDHDINNFFKERFEIDLENEHYEKIDVPDFRGGRQGRFIHDFNINKTGIIDIDGQCCFVMPLNRQRVLPPRNMYDLLRKMYNGYYEVNTAVVRETMRVITPPITDMSTVGTYIARECQDLPTYMLQKVNSTSIVKRSASQNGVFGQFAGNNIMEVDIVNLEDFE
ncbi:PREDICTED: integral membrane protein 2C [Cyphomyrmex costatus]|uniref:Integral membrane protein 2 n=1 Tax=Cyphomyrmex costatus TaxID=456900 RepID=A0A151IHY0_9HYME|nr:PREDICTED: integral membrane protein 2C [Cyphomyrmex costatus]KYN01436.1 Integral membrane protein 2C [Cyphomyrmex costatus]